MVKGFITGKNYFYKASFGRFAEVFDRLAKRLSLESVERIIPVMALSPAEWKRAQLARQEILQRDSFIKRRPWNWFILGWVVLNLATLPLLNPHHCIPNVTMSLFFIALFIIERTRYPSLNSRYAANLQLIEEFRQREPHLYASLAKPREEHPLLEKWCQAREKRAILWQVDQFLSRKSAPPERA